MISACVCGLTSAGLAPTASASACRLPMLSPPVSQSVCTLAPSAFNMLGLFG
jgi:hypothetical protein